MTREQRLRQTLKQLAEQAVPDNVNLWPAIYAQLRSQDKGTTHMQSQIHQSRRRWLALSLAAVVLGLAVIAATPQGQALAQRLLQFFTPAAAPSFPVPVAVAPDALAPTAEPPASPPGCEGLVDFAALTCHVAQAEAALGFDLKAPTADLAGLDFVYAQVFAEQRTAQFVYNAAGGGAGLSLTQGKGQPGDIRWEEIPAEAVVEKVKVAGYEGEYVRGRFVVFANASEATWNPDAPTQRLRWREGDTWFELALDGAVEPVEYLDREALVMLAEGLK